jgi:CBS domain containing-hemolysin-like protein
VATLLLGNLADGVIAALITTVAIVLFGEIVPQSICNRQALRFRWHWPTLALLTATCFCLVLLLG